MNSPIQNIQNIFPNLPMLELESVSQGIMPKLVLRQIHFHMLSNGLGYGTVQKTNDIFTICKHKAEAIFNCDDPTKDHSFIIRTESDDSIMIDDSIISNPEKKSGRGRKVNPNSKMQRSYVMYKNASDKAIKPILELFMGELGLSEGTARAYYHKAKKRYNAGTFA